MSDDSYHIMGDSRVSPCCPPGSLPKSPELHDYVPKGEVVTFENISAYSIVKTDQNFNGRPQIKRAIIFIHDIFGLESGLNKMICDRLAEKLPETIVIAPNFFIQGNILGNDPLKVSPSALMMKLFWKIVCCQICGYIQKYSWDNISGDVFDKTMTHLAALGVTSVFPLGFCWGAYVGMRACGSADRKEMITANISCHPSVAQIASMCSEKLGDILASVACPQMIVATKDEPHDWKPNGTTQIYFNKTSFGSLCEYYLYANERHGFITRGDISLTETNSAIEDCILKIVRFITKLSEIK